MHVKSSMRGFSLIEILVSIALLSILSGIGISLYAIVNNSYNRANSISSIQSQGSSVMEQIERNIRSASDAQLFGPSDCDSGADQCIRLTMPPESLEYKTNNCPIVEYDWIAPVSGVNGKLRKTLLNTSLTSCGVGGANLFDTNTTSGISVEGISGTVFSVNAGTPASVVITTTLYQGAAGSNRSQVPYITTISLRDY